jgi:hypothetical protein
MIGAGNNYNLKKMDALELLDYTKTQLSETIALVIGFI